MGSESKNVVTLANSIIGVGILAMPFCFQKCGILLSIVLLLLSNVITRISCHYLAKASILSRRRNFEYLAFYAFGAPGKLLVEICIIGYLFGTCVAYFVVVGDLGPQITSKMFNLTENNGLRIWVVVLVTVFCVIPLGLLKNIDSLSAVCTVSIGFYICFVVKVIGESQVHLSDDWLEHVYWWRPAGLLQCLPIFSMSLSCQMQLFEVSETMPGVSLDRMNLEVKSATWICTVVYIMVGFFGYVAFCSQEFSGNILVNLSQSISSDVIKIGFVISVAFSFPLVIFPCRASLYSLLYRHGHMESNQYIPETRFRAITVSLVFSSLLVGLWIPSIELVIGLVGSTIGVAICIIFPASCFSRVSKKDSTEKVLAKFLIVLGFCLMILGTYANLNAIEEKQSVSHLPLPSVQSELNALPINELVKPLPPLRPETDDVPIPAREEKKIGNFDRAKKKIAEINERAQKEAESLAKPIEAEGTKEAPAAGQEVMVNSNDKKDLSKDAIKKEEEEIKAVKEDDDTKNSHMKDEIEAVVDEIKRQNEETQKLVLEKLEQLVEKIELKEKEPAVASNKKDTEDLAQQIAKEVHDKFPDPIPVVLSLNATNLVLNTSHYNVNNEVAEQVQKVAVIEEDKPAAVENQVTGVKREAVSQDNVKAPVEDKDNKSDEENAAMRRELLTVDKEEEALVRARREIADSENCEKELL